MNEFYDENEHIFYTSEKKEKTMEDLFKVVNLNKKGFYLMGINKVEFLGKIYKISENSHPVEFILSQDKFNVFITNIHQVNYIISKYPNYKYYSIYYDNEPKKMLGLNLNFNKIIFKINPLDQKDFETANAIIPFDKEISLQSFSLLVKKYQKNAVMSNEKFYLTKERDEFCKNIMKYLDDNYYIAIYGPRSIGKTISLLALCKYMLSNDYFYFNISHIKQLLAENNVKELCHDICKELYNVISFDNSLEAYNILEKIEFNNSIDVLQKIFDLLVKFRAHKITYIIIDQYKSDYDNNNFIIQNLINKCQEYNFRLIICSSINEIDFRKSLKLRFKEISEGDSGEFYLNYLYIDKLVDASYIIPNNINSDIKELSQKFGNLFEYWYKICNNFKKRSIEGIESAIIEQLNNEIKNYFEETDSMNFSYKIKNIFNNIGKRFKFNQLINIIDFFPFKFFSLFANKKGMFFLSEINNGTLFEIKYTFPMVITCLNKIFYNEIQNINELTLNYTSNNNSNKRAIDLEEFFIFFLWSNREINPFNNYKILDILKISSIMDPNDLDNILYLKKLEILKNENDAILIIQEKQGAKFFDGGILVKQKSKKYDLFLFQITTHKNSEERLTVHTLIDCKNFIILFFDKLDITINKVYFAYVFDKENPDYDTIEYCDKFNLCYYTLNIKIGNLKKGNKNTGEVDFYYRCTINNNINNEIMKLEKSKFNKKYYKEELLNYTEFLKKKRKRLKQKDENDINDILKEQNLKIKDKKKNYDLREELITNKLLKEEKSVIKGFTYKLSEESKKLLKEINFHDNELKELKTFIEAKTNLSIIGVKRIDNFCLNFILNYNICVIEKDKRGNKFFIDFNNQNKINLSDHNIVSDSFHFKSDYYFIKMIDSSICE